MIIWSALERFRIENLDLVLFALLSRALFLSFSTNNHLKNCGFFLLFFFFSEKSHCYYKKGLKKFWNVYFPNQHNILIYIRRDQFGPVYPYLITITEWQHQVNFLYPVWQELPKLSKSDNIIWLITLFMITLGGTYCTIQMI
jgi:hypothetical protein